MTSPPTEQLVAVPMPRMGTSITEGEVIVWLKQEGDRVEADETLCEISTDKVESECPAPVAGLLTEILVEVGEVVEVGTVMARIAPEDGGSPAPRRFYSPVARRVAAASDVDLDLVEGSGRGGRVTKRDVMSFVAARDSAASPPPVPPRAPAPPESAPPGGGRGGDSQPLSRMRVAIGTAMRRSLETAATCHTVVECDVTDLERHRRDLGLTALPLVAAATVATLREFPDLNATLTNSTITRYEHVHLGIAVSLGDDGLLVPVVDDAQDLSATGLANRIADLAARARARELGPDEVQGATFTITNPGAFGASIATPIINLPQVAILDLEAISRRPVVVSAPDGAESIAIRSIVNLVLGWDHRAIDGVYAARFLAALRDRLQDV